MATRKTPRDDVQLRQGRTLVPGNGARGGLPLAPPVGMADLVLPESTDRRALGDRLVDTFARYGYDLVATPPFEHAEVLERGLDQVDRRDLLRFVEPETGEVALLRPDITPQIARIIATRLHDRPPPWRLCYEGSVIRRQRGRARKQRQIAQAGVECVGIASPDADVEVIRLMARACEAAGLRDFRIELGQVRIGRAVLESVPEAARDAVTDALVHKDVASLATLLQEAGVPAKDQRAIVGLADLYGDASVLRRARKSLRAPAALEALDELAEVTDRLGTLGLGDRIVLDLGELRGQAYYTGVSFMLLAPGPGQPVGIGGRYDHLLGRYGTPAPATGFALDLGNLAWALDRAGAPFRSALPPRIAVAGQDTATMIDGLRDRGASVAELGALNASKALAFAGAWGYDAALVAARGAVRAHRVIDRSTMRIDPNATGGLDEVLAWAMASRTNTREDG
jgi:ATP phosphoribosyltransferase regulatory subunit